MTATSKERLEIKAIFKEAIVEVLQERSDLLYDVMSDLLEDRAMAEAITESEDDDFVDRKKIMDLLGGEPESPRHGPRFVR